MTIYIANALHLIARDAEGVAADYGLAPDGRPSNGVNHPYGDTLFGLLNKEAVPVTARFRLWKDSGAPVAWPDTGFNYSDVILEPGLGWAASFIPDNGSPNPPLDWPDIARSRRSNRVHSVRCPRIASTPGPWRAAETGTANHRVSKCLSGGTCRRAPNGFSPMQYRTTKTSIMLGRTRMSLAFPNFSRQPVTVTITYVVNQNYPSKGQRWSFRNPSPPMAACAFSMRGAARGRLQPAQSSYRRATTGRPH
jgi:hypothetical protein